MPDEISTSRDEPTIDAAPQSNWVPAITILSGEKEGNVIEIKGVSFTIGRSRGNSLVLNDKAVSRRHAAIEFKDNRYIAHDLQSRWGLKVNGVDVKEADLKYGDEIEIAGTRLGFNLVLKDNVTKQKPRWIRYALIVLAFAAVSATVTLLYFRYQVKTNLDRPGADVVSQIIYHYDKGISHYNQIAQNPANREKAVKEMKKVIELDPNGKTQFSLSARRIIDGLEK